jgi:hypothetical protein
MQHPVNTTSTGDGHSRPKQFAWIPTATAAITAGNVISSATTGDAPLSWFGNTFSSLLGLSTGMGMKVAKVLTLMATSINTLNLNNIKIVEAANSVMDKTSTFKRNFQTTLKQWQ